MAAINRQIQHLVHQSAELVLKSAELAARLTRIERLLHVVVLIVSDHDTTGSGGMSDEERNLLMATRQTLDAMQAAVTHNTSAVAAATDALTHYAQTNTDLTQQLKDAIARADSLDDSEVQAAIAAIEANNTKLVAAAGPTAAAIVANTPAAVTGGT